MHGEHKSTIQRGKRTNMERLNTLISDGAPNFNDVFNKEFFIENCSIKEQQHQNEGASSKAKE